MTDNPGSLRHGHASRRFILMKRMLLIVLAGLTGTTALAETAHLPPLAGHKEDIQAVAYTPDSRYIVTGSYDGLAKLWDVASGTELVTFRGHTDSVATVAVSPDGQLVATGGYDSNVKLWELITGREIATFGGHSDWVMSVAFTPDGSRIVSGSLDGTAKLWDIKTYQELKTFSGHGGGVFSVAVSSDGSLLATGSDDRTAKLWDLGTAEELRTFSGHLDVVHSVAFSPDGGFLATGSHDRTAKLWDVSNRKLIRTFAGHRGWIYSLAFSTEGRYLATASGDRSARLWEISTGAAVAQYSGHKDGVNCLAFSPDGWYLASGGEDNLVLFDEIPFSPVRQMPPDLKAELDFKDQTGDGILEAGETARLNIKIINQGKGPAQRVRVSLEDDSPDRSLTAAPQSVRVIAAPGYCDLTMILKAGMSAGNIAHRVRLSIKEYYGYDLDPAYLIVRTKAVSPPSLALAGVTVVDSGAGTAAVRQDGMVQAGESVRAGLLIQNTGVSVVRGVSYSVSTTDPNIYLDKKSGFVGDVKPGEVKSVWLTVSPNKRVFSAGALPIYVTVRDRLGMSGLISQRLPLELDKPPAPPVIAPSRTDTARLGSQRPAFEFSSNRFTVVPDQTVDVWAIDTPVTKRSNAIAVLFAAEQYRELPAAPYAVNNARLMQKYLEQRLGVGKLLFYQNQEVAGLVFDDVFNPVNGRLQREVAKGYNEITVYYSGRLLPNKTGTEMYLFPADGKTARLEQEGYSLTQLFASLAQIGAAAVTVIIDAEYPQQSDLGSRYRAAEPLVSAKLKLKSPQPWSLQANTTVMLACEGYANAAGYDPGELGLFTYFLAAGLQGKADGNGDKQITLNELKKYVVGQVADNTWKIGRLQIPVFFGDLDRVIVQW